MKTVSFYHKSTGLLNDSTLTATNDRAIALNTPADHVAIAGRFDALSQKVDVASGKVVDYQPPAPSADHVWNTTSKRWEPSPATVATATARRLALASIQQLENSQHRAVREMLIGTPGALDRLKAIEEQIVAYRKDL